LLKSLGRVDIIDGSDIMMATSDDAVDEDNDDTKSSAEDFEESEPEIQGINVVLKVNSGNHFIILSHKRQLHLFPSY
jgi:hypothetical protein